MDAKLRGQQMRQHKTSHERSGDQPGNGVQPELRQTRKARQEQRGKAGDRRQHAEPDGGPETLDPALPILALLLGLHEQVDRIIHRLADQRGAKSQGNAVYRPKA